MHGGGDTKRLLLRLFLHMLQLQVVHSRKQDFFHDAVYVCLNSNCEFAISVTRSISTKGQAWQSLQNATVLYYVLVNILNMYRLWPDLKLLHCLGQGTQDQAIALHSTILLAQNIIIMCQILRWIDDPLQLIELDKLLARLKHFADLEFPSFQNSLFFQPVSFPDYCCRTFSDWPMAPGGISSLRSLLEWKHSKWFPVVDSKTNNLARALYVSMSPKVQAMNNHSSCKGWYTNCSKGSSHLEIHGRTSPTTSYLSQIIANSESCSKVRVAGICLNCKCAIRRTSSRASASSSNSQMLAIRRSDLQGQTSPSRLDLPSTWQPKRQYISSYSADQGYSLLPDPLLSVDRYVV